MAAPLAQLDKWRDLAGFRDVVEREKQLDRVNLNCEEVSELLESFSEPDNGLCGETVGFTSMADLVEDFDQHLLVCFRNVNNTTSGVNTSVKPISEDTVLKNDEIWNALTDNYGSVMPVDWRHSRTRSLHLPSLKIEDRPRKDNVNLDVSDDEDLREQMDMHSIVVSCINEEPLFTAEQVIEEIEEMMQYSPDLEAEQNLAQSDLTQRASSSKHSSEERVRNLSLAELNELLEEVETTIRRHSEELVQNLALRDELDFEKEVKNSFISVLIDVQNRQKEHREFLKKKRKVKTGAGGQHSRAERLPTNNLTTVIPYEKKGGPPSVGDLQILTKILQAMRDDSDKVPSLLTDYILKVLCPT
ncbi:fasciculation and elongation protein zeta-2 isoform X2 [Brachyhypopomus gauderio]|uniref:fasciculation and elongation protein zeta-2 isoform X2 n=1 Tax=Brachyhypopomus gauderio TaxID=698409 RepID=UPI00404134F3